MTISASEQRALTCVACGEAFEAEVWTLIDGGERPDLAQALLDGTLDEAICPHCKTPNQGQLALLFHDPERRRVFFAVPSGVEEHRWRDQAQTLLYTLVEQLPEEMRLPYLGDVQVDQEIAGLRRSLLRRQRARSSGATPGFGKPIPLPGSPAPVSVPPPTPHAPSPKPQAPGFNLAEAVEQMMAASSLDDLRTAVQRFPQLLSEDADALLRQFAEAAANQGDRDAANALHAARTALVDLRVGRDVRSVMPNEAAELASVQELGVLPMLPEPAYQALLHTVSDASLMEAIRAFPVLLEHWADVDLFARTEATLDEGNERLATLIEERRDALGELRVMLLGVEPLDRAVQALLAARDTDAVERALNEHPALLTDAAQRALLAYAEAARAQGNDAIGAEADARRTMLQEVRAGLG